MEIEVFMMSLTLYSESTQKLMAITEELTIAKITTN